MSGRPSEVTCDECGSAILSRADLVVLSAWGAQRPVHRACLGDRMKGIGIGGTYVVNGAAGNLAAVASPLLGLVLAASLSFGALGLVLGGAVLLLGPFYRLSCWLRFERSLHP